MQFDSVVLVDDIDTWNNLLPLSATRSIADCRVGILTIKEKWEQYLKTSVSIKTIDYIQSKYNKVKNELSSNKVLIINSSVFPNYSLINILESLSLNSALLKNNNFIALLTDEDFATNTINSLVKKCTPINYNETLTTIKYAWDIFIHNGNQIKEDIALLNLKPNPDALSKTNTILGNKIYVEEEVYCEASILNATQPIYLGKHSEVMEGCTIRGTFALCEYSTLKLQSKIYGDTTIGPHSKVGGEVSNSVIFGYSNKAHDGFLGNSIIGEWCNLGADTNNSNLKNNYSKVKAWNYPSADYINTDLQFCGLIMADHAKAAINTQFNTGTTVGVSANVFYNGFPPKFIPDFSWGVDKECNLNSAFEIAARVMQRRGIELSDYDKSILSHIFNQTKELRK